MRRCAGTRVAQCGAAAHAANKEMAMKIRTQLKSGGLASNNHNEALKVRSTIKGGAMPNHNEALRVRSTVKAARAGESLNHNEALKVRSSVKAGCRKAGGQQ